MAEGHFQHRQRMVRSASGLTLGVLLAMQAAQASAQPASAPGPAGGAAAQEPLAIGEVVVTAQRREENLQNVPISVTAISGGELAKRAVLDSTDVVKLIPALKYNAYSPSTTVYNLRGVSQNDYSDQLEPPVAVYQDDSYMSSMAMAGFPLFDIERVEAVRGPQGTLFGRNATGGAIQFISRKPGNSLALNGSATAFTDGGFALEAAAGGPVSDTLSMRAAVMRLSRDGFVKDLRVPDHGEVDEYAGRLQLQWTPRDDLKVALRAMASQDDPSAAGGSYSYRPAVPTDHGRGVYQLPTEDFWGTGAGKDPGGYSKPANLGDYTIESDTPSVFKRTIQAYTARVDWNLSDSITLISITDLQRMRKSYQEDCDGSPVPDCVFAPRTRLHQFSQELRLEGGAGDLKWVAGANYIDIDGHYQSHAEYNLVGLDYFSTGDSDYRIRTKSPSVFAQATVPLSSALKVTAGARYTRDKKTDNYLLNFSSTFGGVTDSQVVPFNPALYPDLAKKTYDLYSGKLQVDYTPSDNILLYAGVTRGTKSGNFAAPVTAPVVIARLPHGPETLWDYEAGIKSRFLDNRLLVNASVFYYDYKNYQTFALIDLVQTISNRDAWVRGGELEVTALPARGLTLSAGVSYLESRVKDVGLPDGTIVDSRLPQAPRLSGNASIAYTHPAGNGELSARLDGYFTTGFCFSVVCAPIERERAYQTLDASLSYEIGKVTITGFVKNLTGEKYRTYALDVAALGVAEDIYNRPRYGGVTIAYRY